MSLVPFVILKGRLGSDVGEQCPTYNNHGMIMPRRPIRIENGLLAKTAIGKGFMSSKNNKMILNWLVIVAGLIVIMVLFGGYVRLTRSGLSIVEWNPISGIIPPIGPDAWEAEFAKYQATPEFQYINSTMTLAGYKQIFYLEYVHRLIGRFAGLVVALPLLYMLWRGIIPWRKSALYVSIGLLFAFQGYMGWYMVSSGLVDRPEVSHLRLTAHLLTAILLLGLTVWAALNHHYGFPERRRGAFRSISFLLASALDGAPGRSNRLGRLHGRPKGGLRVQHLPAHVRALDSAGPF